MSQLLFDPPVTPKVEHNATAGRVAALEARVLAIEIHLGLAQPEPPEEPETPEVSP